MTGAAGFIGSFLVERLLDLGYGVVGVDNLSSGCLDNLSGVLKRSGFRFLRGDLLDPSSLDSDFFGVDVVFHLAANPEVRHSIRDPLDHYHQNVTATMNALEMARRGGAGVFVFASSSTVYGDAGKIPTPEDHPLRPISIYGATKAAGEILCQTYARLYKMKCLVLRYANIIGPRLRHGVIYDFINKLRGNKEELEILGDGSQRKSYLHIEDAIEATLRALETLIERDEGEEIYNIGNRDWISVTEIAEIVAETMGLKGVRYRYSPATPDGRGWPGDVKLMLLDIEKIEKKTKWRPRLNTREAVKRATKEILSQIL